MFLKVSKFTMPCISTVVILLVLAIFLYLTTWNLFAFLICLKTPIYQKHLRIVKLKEEANKAEILPRRVNTFAAPCIHPAAG